MQKTTIGIIIALMTVALIGLTGFQVYWINNAIQLNRQQFKSNVHETLTSISERIEKQEALKITARKILNVDPDRAASISVTANQGGTFVFFDSEEEYHHEEIIIENHSDKGTSSIKSKVTFLMDSLDTTIQRKVIRKEQIVDVMLEELLHEPRDIRSRIDFAEIDSLLSKGLHDKGIDINYQFAVWNSKEDDIVLTNTSSNIAKLKTAAFKASLFPNDLVGNVNYLMLNFPDQNQFLFKQIGATLATSLVFILIIIGCFSYAIFIIMRQKKLSEIKNDFINNMTHEFKTPIATVGLACEAMTEPQVMSNGPTLLRYIGVIQDENQRLGEQVEKVLHAALLDKNSFKLQREVLNIHPIISATVDKLSIQAQALDGTITLELHAIDDKVKADKHHLANVLHNLVDNAIKYSPEQPQVTIKSQTIGTTLFQFSVSDKGRGMNRDQLKNIFARFYRVPTGDLHNTKGFGLGLSYVKTIVELHDGSISVDSKPGYGTTFTINLPLHE